MPIRKFTDVTEASCNLGCHKESDPSNKKKIQKLMLVLFWQEQKKSMQNKMLMEESHVSMTPFTGGGGTHPRL